MSDDDRRDAAVAIANMMSERNTARLERDHFKAEAEQLREDLKVANQNEAALQGHFDIAVENAERAEAENERLRAVVEAAKTHLHTCVEHWREQGAHVAADQAAKVYRMLAAVDVSGNIGGHPIAQRPQQQFMSNACIHDDHNQCETECGYCHDGCACSCHPWAGAAPEDDE